MYFPIQIDKLVSEGKRLSNWLLVAVNDYSAVVDETVTQLCVLDVITTLSNSPPKQSF